jgi:quinolinate synthase
MMAEEIAALKARQHAVILAHHYQDEEVQEVADSVGDTLELTRVAESFKGKVIVLCGAKFMAELANVVNPSRSVILPDLNAGCSLVDSCPAEAVRAFRQRHPGHTVVSYINTSAAVKAESDILCTADNAVAVVNSIPPERPILFLPDINLGNWVKKHTGRQNMQIWQGACIVHATFPARRLITARSEHPSALVAAHAGCGAEILRMADFIGSTSAIVDWCSKQSTQEFIICSEDGVRYSLELNSPGKRFYFVANENCNCSACPYLRLNTLEKLLSCLKSLSPRIKLDEDLMTRARLPYQRMLTVQ